MTMLQRSNLSVEKSRSLPVEIKVFRTVCFASCKHFSLVFNFNFSYQTSTSVQYIIEASFVFCPVGVGQKYLEDHKLMILSKQ